MKYFKFGRSYNYIENSLSLLDAEGEESRIFSLTIIGDKLNITEECDGYFSAQYSKQQFLGMLDELKSWLENQ